ncbi:MAG: tetratricopeptide repeat protein [Gemmatimonadetes bacterium]|nr:tetratricopeptide repeat protein [Gemmatimonadota bacterium]
MSELPGRPAVRVEQALRILPELEVLAPLRAVLMAAARADDLAQWGPSGPYLTLGKRGVRPEDLRSEIPKAIQRVATHLGALYEHYIEALEARQSRDGVATVKALLRAGEREEAVERLAQARAWYEVALTVSEELQDRRPEIETLRVLGHLGLRQGRYSVAARAFQRSFVLAEAEFDQAGAIAACQGLGEADLTQGEWRGARAWFARGLRLAEAADDDASIGSIEHQIAVLALREGDLSGVEDHLARAYSRFEKLGNTTHLAEAMNTRGVLETTLNRFGRAASAYREALAWLRKGEANPAVEISIRLNLADMYLRTERVLEAEEEIRRAEELAIGENLPRRLIEIYSLMGKLRGHQSDETGFVFFEQAVELCRTMDCPPALEGEVYYGYGLFRGQLGNREEARAYLERAREIFESVGGGSELARVREELKRMSA